MDPTQTNQQTHCADTHSRTLIGLATSGALCEPCPLPWSCERCDEFFGPNTAHVWTLIDAEDKVMEYLSAETDGPAFVAWINMQGAAQPLRGS